jgi:hypothetical protein
MSFASEASKLLTNKYFLYFILFLAVSNVVGYLVTNKINAVIFFVLICVLMTNFSKNMVIVLIVAIISTNLLMANKSMREGFDTTDPVDPLKPKDEKVETDAKAATDAKAMDAKAMDAKAMDAKAVDPLKPKDAKAMDAKATDAKATDAKVEPVVDEGFASAGVGSSGKKRGAIGGPAKPSRIDYATTLEDAYDNLDKILGSGGMKNLSADTEKLMSQQQSLFKAMNSMMPLVTNAQDMLKGLDMGKIGSMIDMTKSFGLPKE